MKKTLLFSITLFLVFSGLNGQAKRYIFLEHFTNTWCGICGATNPGFYTLLANFKNQYHHMTVHPSIPYAGCLLFQANPSDNSQRSSFYSINSTPTILINGLTKKSAAGTNATILNAELNKFSPIEVKVTESGTNVRTVNIDIKTLGTKPLGNYKIYVVALEKELHYASPNGEKVHHNVFRDFLSAPSGDDVLLADMGSSTNKNYTITLHPSWVENQIYILAWVQDVSSKEVLNSGTKFDVLSANKDVPEFLQFSIYPNPVKETLNLQWTKSLSSVLKLTITNLFGKEVYSSTLKYGSSLFQLPVGNYAKGIYFVKIESGKDKISRKWLKD